MKGFIRVIYSSNVRVMLDYVIFPLVCCLMVMFFHWYFVGLQGFLIVGFTYVCNGLASCTSTYLKCYLALWLCLLIVFVGLSYNIWNGFLGL